MTVLKQALDAYQSGNLAEAEKFCRDVLAAEPAQAEARYHLGLIHGKQGRAADAVRELSRTLETKPDFFDAWFMLCDFADQIGGYDLSRFAGEQTVRLRPDFARGWLRYGLALSRLERDEEAVGVYLKSLALDPKEMKAWINLGMACKKAGRPREALTAFHEAYAAAGVAVPDETAREVDDDAYALLDFHLALTELLLGDYRQGFARYRARFKGATDWRRMTTPRPVWRGENLAGKTILVTTEGGHGDALMMCRYLPLLKGKGARVLFRAPPALVSLLEGWSGADEIFPIGGQIPGAFDYHAAMFDLPHRFGTTVETIPAAIPYLPVPEPDAKIRLMGNVRPRVGVAWAGNAAHENDKRRSLTLPLIAEIFAETGWQFFSLARDARPGERELLARYPVTDLGPMIADFADSAKFVGQLDLIITCDTATAHLAGGMGKPVWTLLPFAPDWRWLLERDDSPWYPSMRLFRQRRKGDWGDVIARVRDALSARTAGFPSP